MNISVKKFSKKSLSLLIALIMVFSALPLTPPISADAATQTMTFTYSSRGYIAGHRASDNRYDKVSTSTPSINICNDGEASNFCAGFWNYTFSSRPSGRITVNTAKVNLNVLKIENGAQQVDVSVYAVGNSLTSTNSVSTAAAALNLCTKKVKIGTFSNSSIGAKELDCKQAITTMLNEDWQYFNLLLVIEDYGASTGGGNGWTDTHVQQPTLSVTLDVVEATTITADDNANSTTNRVKIGDAIYTYESSSAYYNYGKTISTESDWNTPISTTNTISKVECLDDGSLLTVSNDNKLSGTFYDNKFKVSENTSVNATLKFTFSDGKIEYHRVAVKSYPVENHVCVFAERSGESEAGYTMFLRGSTGSGGSGVWNYNKSYYTSGNTAHGSPDRNYVVSDKKAYVYAYSYSDWRQDNNAVPSVSLATYYIDKSCSGTSWSSLGNSELWNSSTNNYSISIDLVRTKFQYPLGNGWTLDLNNSPVRDKLTIPQNPQKSDVNGTTYTSTFTHNSSVSTSNRYSSCNDTTCNVRLAVHAHDKGWALMKTNMVVNLFDKSAARNLYINYLNENKVSDSYTADSFAAYQNALLDMEAYLSNYEDTTNATTSQSVYTNLVNAHDNLKARRYTVTFTRTNYDDPQLSAETIKTVQVEPGNSIPDSKFPDFSKISYKSNNQHYEYFWQIEENFAPIGELTSSTKVDKDITVREVKKTVNCSIVNKGIQDDKVNLECSVCKNKSTLDASAYKAAVLAAQASIDNSQAYTETSRNELINLLSEQNTAINKAKTQQEVENCTSAIVSANQLKTENNSAGKLVYNQYSITLNYVDEKGAGLGTQEITNVNYGTIKEVSAETNFGNKSYVVYKWTRLKQNGDVLSGLNSTSISVNVVGDLTYYVHLKSTQAEYPDNTAVVTLNNKAGKPVDVGYVTTNEPQNVVVNGNSIKIGTDTTLTAPQYSFYSVKGFIVNNELLTAESGTKSITVTKDMTIIPLYHPESYVDITRKSGEKFTINGKNIDKYSAKWDELITLETTDDVIWYTTTKNNKEVVLGKGSIFKFRANEKIEIYTKQVVASLTPNSRVGYFGYDADLKKVTIVNNFFVPDGANENVKAGVVVSTKAKTRDEMIAQYNAGSLKFEGGYDKFTTDKNQIRITINRNGTGDFSMWALSYVIVNGTTYFADDVISYTYNSPSKTA